MSAQTKAKRSTGRAARPARSAHEAFTNAVSHQSTMNYPAIFEGFEAMGIPADEIKPRENVFSFNAWRALGRVVSKGQHGVKVCTFIPCEHVDKGTGEITPGRRPWNTTVFHVSQTHELEPTPTVAN